MTLTTLITMVFHMLGLSLAGAVLWFGLDRPGRRWTAFAGFAVLWVVSPLLTLYLFRNGFGYWSLLPLTAAWSLLFLVALRHPGGRKAL